MPRGSLVTALFSTAFLALAPSAAAAQTSLLLQGLADLEAWETDPRSRVLARNDGTPGLVGRVTVWGAVELGPRVVVYAAGELEGGNARQESGTEWYTDLAAIRYTHSPALVLDVGKMSPPVGAFAARRYSNRNPLVGQPDGYPVRYPWGAQLSGALGRMDYRAAVVSLPTTHEAYMPEPESAARPGVGIGWTPMIGVRIGASATWGPYLNADLAPSLLNGRDWRDYRQQVIALDARASWGYLELRGELATSRYEVPGDDGAPARDVDGFTWYTEAKYTFTPRTFMAARLERNDYAYVQPRSSSTWIASPTNMYNAEAGVGYRIDAQTLVKLSVRADRWYVAPDMREMLPDGHAVAVQLSRGFDLVGLARRWHDLPLQHDRPAQ